MGGAGYECRCPVGYKGVNCEGNRQNCIEILSHKSVLFFLEILKTDSNPLHYSKPAVEFKLST